MDKTVEGQASVSNQSAQKNQPVLKLAQDVSEWAKEFFTLTEEEKKAAGIRDYKNDSF
jgi:hypothetical protein